MSGALGGRAARSTRKQQRDESSVQSQAFATLPLFVNSPFEMSTSHGLLPDLEYDYFKTQYPRAMGPRIYANETSNTRGSPHTANTLSTYPDSSNSSGYENDDIFTVAPSADQKHLYQPVLRKNSKPLPPGLGISNFSSDASSQYQATVAPLELDETCDSNLLSNQVGLVEEMDSLNAYDHDVNFDMNAHLKSAGMFNGMDSSPSFSTNSSSRTQSTPQSASSSSFTNENGHMPFSAQGPEICLNYNNCGVGVKPRYLVHADATAATDHQGL